MVSGVDCFSPAAKAGLEIGDCVLEVNGFDVLGLRITEIAKLVKSSESQVTLLLWNSKCNSGCSEESLCAAPMPQTLQRLSTIVQCVLNVLECPVCRDTITPPAMQCQNGHLLCVECRIRAENCPVCRDRYYPRPALIAEQLQTAITSAFNLCRNEDKVRQKIFGRHNRQLQMVKATLECAGLKRQLHKSMELSSSSSLATMSLPDRPPVQKSSETMTARERLETDMSSQKHCNRTANGGVCNKLLTKLFNFKAYSMENLTNNTNTNARNVSDTVKPSILSGLEAYKVNENGDRGEEGGGGLHGYEVDSVAKQQLNTNQFQAEDFIAAAVERQCQQGHSFSATRITNVPGHHHQTNVDNDVNINSNVVVVGDCRCKQMFSNSSRHFSLSSCDLTMKQSKTAPASAATTTIKSTPITRTKSMATITDEAITKPTSYPFTNTTATDTTVFTTTAFLNKTSPIWFQRRPFPKRYEQSMPKTIASTQGHSQQNFRNNIKLPLASETCRHSDNGDEDVIDCDDVASTLSSNNPTTPSTISLKSLCSF
ncbi:uncharacterized protein isoform X2 [Musca autumnalis]|uniref:uncharacterized protein isoform X2 n=1 Tax=Musca autumnalis TaxID=221902 RepID=UPI003CF49187